MGDPFVELFGDTIGGLLGFGSCEAPPDAVPLRILGLTEMPANHDELRAAFRRRVMQLHPDLNSYSGMPAVVNKAVTATTLADPTVQEAKWARDVLSRKVPTVTAANRNGHATVASRHSAGPAGVTTDDIRARSTSSSRNDERTAKRQARIATLVPEIERERAERLAKGWHVDRRPATSAAGELFTKLAKRDCRWCTSCGQDLAPDAPVWRIYSNYQGVVPWCADCWNHYPHKRPIRSSGPCAICRRLVHDKRWRHPITCSEACSAGLDLARRRAARAEARAGRTCDGCGEPFDADRADARYCSPACRQAAYRTRHANGKENP